MVGGASVRRLLEGPFSDGVVVVVVVGEQDVLAEVVEVEVWRS